MITPEKCRAIAQKHSKKSKLIYHYACFWIDRAIRKTARKGYNFVRIDFIAFYRKIKAITDELEEKYRNLGFNIETNIERSPYSAGYITVITISWNREEE